MKRIIFVLIAAISVTLFTASCGTTKTTADHSFRQVRHKGTCMFRDHDNNRAKRQAQLNKLKTMPQRQTKGVAAR